MYFPTAPVEIHTDHREQIILPVVERSVTIAGISTRELVSKDFAADPNEERLRKAGHFMAQSSWHPDHAPFGPHGLPGLSAIMMT